MKAQRDQRDERQDTGTARRCGVKARMKLRHSACIQVLVKHVRGLSTPHQRVSLRALGSFPLARSVSGGRADSSMGTSK